KPVHGPSGSRAPARRLYKTNFSPVLDGRAVEKSRENRNSREPSTPAWRRSPWLPLGFGLRGRRRVLLPAGFHRSYRQNLFVEHDLGGLSGSAVDAARRAGYRSARKGPSTLWHQGTVGGPQRR